MKCKSVEHWEKVLKAQHFGGLRVLCRIPRNLRESRGVIYGIDPSIEIDDITSHLEEMGVVDARRLTTVRDGVKVNTTWVVLSFGNPVLPPKSFPGVSSLHCMGIHSTSLKMLQMPKVRSYCSSQKRQTMLQQM